MALIASTVYVLCTWDSVFRKGIPGSKEDKPQIIPAKSVILVNLLLRLLKHNVNTQLNFIPLRYLTISLPTRVMSKHTDQFQ